MSLRLRLTISNARFIEASTDSGAIRNAEVCSDPLLKKTIGMFEEWLLADKLTKREELEVLGEHLYRMLFCGEVQSFFEQQLMSVPEGERLRVELAFAPDSNELANFPWEYLYYPDTSTHDGRFFATDVDLVLSRYMSLDQGHQPLNPETGRLRSLVVVSAPADLEQVLPEPVIEEIKKLAEVQPLTVDVLNTPTIDKFEAKLQDFDPHLLHIIGHGRFNRQGGKGEIAMLAPDERSQLWIDDREFAEIFRQTRSTPRLVFLHLCESGTVDFSANFAGLAPRLIRAGIPAVVAMQYRIRNKDAIIFSRNFYRELVERQPIDRAVQIGRYKLAHPGRYNSRIFGTPVLYMRSNDGIILPPSTDLSPKPKWGFPKILTVRKSSA